MRTDSYRPPGRRASPVLCLLFLSTAVWLVAAPAFRPEKLAELDAAILNAIAEDRCPGGVLWLEHDGHSYHKAFGRRAVVPAEEPMTEDTIFDAASLTKVCATTPAIMLLVERGQVKLDAPVCTYIPEFTGEGKEAVTVRHLLTHTSGLRPGIETRSDWAGQAAAIAKACAEKLQSPPGTALRYSDINFFLLGEIVQRVSKTGLEQFCAREIYQPLRMADTGFLPPPERRPRIAPTEVVNGRPYRGIVHDPTARKMGGVAGHAGLFTTAADLAQYARMLLNLGELDGVRLLQPDTVRLMTSVQTPASVGARRGLGWDIDSGYSGPRGRWFPLGSYGHTGWTGTSLWIDPFSRTFVIFLSNRNHPTEKGNVIPLRATLGTLAAEAIADFNFVGVPGALPPRPTATNEPAASTPRRPASATVLNGIDVLVQQDFAPLRGKRVGLITNHTGHDRQRRPTVDLLFQAPGLRLVKLFSPEHGIRGTADEKVGDSRDERTGLPIHSLYGETRKPTAEQLADLDALVFDIQDIGCRFYTYPSTLGLALEAAAEHRKELIVLDRVNPITGAHIGGPVRADKPSFVGFYTVPVRHGLTVGELARLYNAEQRLNARLTVIGCQGWRRAMWFDETGLPWTNPSPNMRSLTAATLYPGIGLLESALSVGRGTDTPFEVLGAPYIEDTRLARELNDAGLPGIRFVPIQFTPAASIHKGELCRGVHCVLTDRDACPVVDVGLLIAKTLYRWYPGQFAPEKMRHLLLHPATLEAIRADKPLAEIRALWAAGLEEFEKRRQSALLYE